VTADVADFEESNSPSILLDTLKAFLELHLAQLGFERLDRWSIDDVVPALVAL
jgi:hypothetical protein